MKIDVGGSNHPKQGYASVDKYSPDADYQADFINLPFPDNSIQEVYTSHTLEHLGKNEVPVALKEIYRVLEPEGTFTIIVPDLEYCVTVYGNQEHVGEYHKTGFTKDSLQKLVENAGLKVTRSDYIFDHAVQSIIIEGVKDGKSSI